MFVTPAFAQDGGAGLSGGAAFGSLMPIVLIFIIFYFLLIRPQQKKMKEHRAMVEALRRGDQVVTSGGIVGKVSKVQDDGFVEVEIAEGVKMVRPDLTVFVNTGDGDCCSIGAAHWIHAIRYNMNLTVFLHDNQIYGLTKKQASPTSPIGTKSNTTPRGSYLDALNPLSVTLGVANASFVAQAVDWIPESLFEIVKAAYHHKGLSFVRILQRCPEWLPKSLDPWMHDPDRIQLLHHENALHLSAGLAKTYRNQLLHDPLDMNRAREIASSEDVIPVGILYQNRDIPRYEETRQTGVLRTTETVRKGFEAELDKYTV